MPDGNALDWYQKLPFILSTYFQLRTASLACIVLILEKNDLNSSNAFCVQQKYNSTYFCSVVLHDTCYPV